MTIKICRNLICFCFACFIWLGSINGIPASANASTILNLWNNGDTKTTIIDFVETVSSKYLIGVGKNPNYVPPEDRIAVFDNDGTLWSEQPCYFQFEFIADKQGMTCTELKNMNDGKREAILASLPAQPMTIDQYKEEARTFLEEEYHPEITDHHYIELVFQPMLQLINYLKQNDFRVYIVSGGDIDFVRSFAEDVYGIPPENVVGSYPTSCFVIDDATGEPVVLRGPCPEANSDDNSAIYALLEDHSLLDDHPDLEEFLKNYLKLKLKSRFYYNDGATKPAGIARFIGKKPIMAVGNSNGDLEMLQYTDDGDSNQLMMLVKHDDPCREYFEYTCDEHVDEVLQEADARGWSIISMKNDFRQIFLPAHNSCATPFYR